MQTGLPLPGVEDYILMISAHLDTVFCFTSLACVETTGSRGELSSALKHWNALFVFALDFVSPWTCGVIKIDLFFMVPNPQQNNVLFFDWGSILVQLSSNITVISIDV